MSNFLFNFIIAITAVGIPLSLLYIGYRLGLEQGKSDFVDLIETGEEKYIEHTRYSVPNNFKESEVNHD